MRNALRILPVFGLKVAQRGMISPCRWDTEVESTIAPCVSIAPNGKRAMHALSTEISRMDSLYPGVS